MALRYGQMQKSIVLTLAKHKIIAEIQGVYLQFINKSIHVSKRRFVLLTFPAKPFPP